MEVTISITLGDEDVKRFGEFTRDNPLFLQQLNAAMEEFGRQVGTVRVVEGRPAKSGRKRHTAFRVPGISR